MKHLFGPSYYSRKRGGTMECAETLFEFLVIGEEIITEAREPEKIKTSV